MRRFCFSLLFLTFVTATLTDVLPAQYGEDACLLTLTGQNRNRKVAGVVNAECGNERIGSISVGPIEIELAHSPPFGNWGVRLKLWPRDEDSDQFKGWSYQNPRFGKPRTNGIPAPRKNQNFGSQTVNITDPLNLRPIAVISNTQTISSRMGY